MKRFFLLATILFLASSAYSADDRFWLSFTNQGLGFLVQIDTNGNVTKNPVLVSGIKNGNNASAMSEAGGDFFYYYALNLPQGNVRVGLINKNAPALTAFQPFGDPASFDFSWSVSATQGDATKFLVYEKSRKMKGHGSSNNGLFDGFKFRISPRTDGSLLNGGVSSDGRMGWVWAAQGSQPRMYAQPLRADGLPTGTPRVVAASAGVAQIDGNALVCADISGVLSNGNRLVVYRLDAGDLFTKTGRISLQQIDGTTGAKVGGPLVYVNDLRVGTFDDIQTVAIDPQARFFVFTSFNLNCFRYEAFFQALDSSGNPNGNPVSLINCSETQTLNSTNLIGLDLLKD